MQRQFPDSAAFNILRLAYFHFDISNVVNRNNRGPAHNPELNVK